MDIHNVGMVVYGIWGSLLCAINEKHICSQATKQTLKIPARFFTTIYSIRLCSGTILRSLTGPVMVVLTADGVQLAPDRADHDEK